MKRKICGVIFAIGLFLIWGIAGGVDCGEPLSNAWWCLPIMFVMCVALRVGNLLDCSVDED